MAPQQKLSRWIRFQDFWEENQGLYVFGGVVIGLLLFPLLNMLSSDISVFLEGLVPEGVGIAFTVFFLDRLNQRREEKLRLLDTQERLIREAGSSSNETAKAAISDLMRRGWLAGEDGLLQGQWLHYADLKGANLYFANLRGTDLRGSELMSADLIGADLTGADIKNANLTGAILEYVDKKTGEARRANFTDVQCNENTILPDGSKWSPATDWRQYGAIIDAPQDEAHGRHKAHH